MAIDVDHRDPFGTKGTQPLDGQRGVVDIAMTSGTSGERMMPRRPRQCVGGTTRGGLIRGGESTGGSPVRGSPGMRPDRTGGVGGKPARLSDDVLRHASAVADHFRRWMTVRNDLLTRIRQQRPGGMC